jgi:hypothetical protein
MKNRPECNNTLGCFFQRLHYFPDETITPDGQDDWKQHAQTHVSKKLVMLPDKPKSNGARRALNGVMCNNKMARRLKIFWIRLVLSKCRQYIQERVEDIITKKAFDLGMIQKGKITEKGNGDWKNINL